MTESPGRANPNTCGTDAGTLAGCRKHLDAGQLYCARCNAAWRATYRHTYPNHPRDEHGSLPPRSRR